MGVNIFSMQLKISPKPVFYGIKSTRLRGFSTVVSIPLENTIWRFRESDNTHISTEERKINTLFLEPSWHDQ